MSECISWTTQIGCIETTHFVHSVLKAMCGGCKEEKELFHAAKINDHAIGLLCKSCIEKSAIPLVGLSGDYYPSNSIKLTTPASMAKPNEMTQERSSEYGNRSS